MRSIMKKNRISQILDEYTREWEIMTIQDPSNPNQCLEVAPPYVMNVSNYIKENHRTGALWDKYKHSLEFYENCLPNLDNVDPHGGYVGKARPEVIKAFLDTYAGELIGTHKDIRSALKYYGIGVDCSGFVSRAIARVMRILDISPELKLKTLGYYKDKDEKPEGPYRSNCTVIEPKGSKDVDPSEIKPGDILYNRKDKNHHVRIVLEVVENDADQCQFITAESSASDKLRVLRKKWIYLKKENKLFYAFLNRDGSIEKPVITSKDYANLREDYSTKASIIAQIPNNTELDIDFTTRCISSDKSVWYKVSYDGNDGYLCSTTFKGGFVEEEKWAKRDVTFKFGRPLAFIGLDESDLTLSENPIDDDEELYATCLKKYADCNAETSSSANLREGCSSMDAIIFEIPKGNRIFVDLESSQLSDFPKKGSKWYKASYGFYSGYLWDHNFKKKK